MSRRVLVPLACVTPVLVFLAVFVPAAGHGFLKDDFGWILTSRLTPGANPWRQIEDVLRTAHGFYRPMVALSFTANAALNGTDARAYGLTNVALVFACAGAIAALARSLGLPRAAAWFAACLWFMNVHAVPGTVLWISGRTYLLLTVAGATCALLLVRRRPAAAGVVLLVALFTKEEATLLPLVLTGWLVLLRPHERSGWLVWLASSLGLLGVYLAVRSTTSAITPLTAPPYYHLSFGLATLVPNVRHYADFTFTIGAAVLLIAWLVLGCPRPRFNHDDRIAIGCGLVWLVGGFGLTIAVPVRSDLYACFPSVGSCLASAVVIRRMWADAAPARRPWALATAVVIACLIGAVDATRAQRLVRQAELSSTVLAELPSLALATAPAATVEILDDVDHPLVNARTAFGTFLADAVWLVDRRHVRVWIDPPSIYAGADSPPACASCPSVRLRLRDGHLAAE